MANTTFQSGTIVEAAWLNDVNDVVYDVLGDGSVVPTSKAGLRTALDVPQTDGTGATGTWPVDISGNAATATNATNASNATGPAASTTTAGIVELATNAEAQTGTSTTVAITPANLKAAQIQLGTAVTASNQTAIEFTGIPSWARRVTVMFSGLSTNSAGAIKVQLGTASSYETSGYEGSCGGATNTSTMSAIVETSGFSTVFSNAVNTNFGIISLFNLTGNQWVSSGTVGLGNLAAWGGNGGSKTLSNTLTRVRLYVDGTIQFDAGTANISWE